MAYRTTQFKGDIASTHNSHVGNDLYVVGDSILHNVKIKGWLDCEHIKDVNKGMFATVEDLRRSYPLPEDGWIAIVGNTLPGPVYRALSGRWIKTEAVGGEWLGDVDYYNTEVADVKERLSETEEGLSQLIDIVNGELNPIRISRIVDRGMWSAEETYYFDELNPSIGYYEISYVWHNGCKYRCAKTCKDSKPRWNNTYWVMVEGNSTFSVEFEEDDFVFNPDNFKTTLTIVAKMYNDDVTKEIQPNDIIWSRYSEDENGVERVASDNIWSLEHSNVGKQITLTKDDCGFYGYIPKALKFIATVTLRDNIGQSIDTAKVTLEL